MEKIRFHKYGSKQQVELQALLESLLPLGTTKPTDVLAFFEAQKPRRYSAHLNHDTILCLAVAGPVPGWKPYFYSAYWFIRYRFDRQVQGIPNAINGIVLYRKIDPKTGLPTRMRQRITMTEMRNQGYFVENLDQTRLVNIDLRYEITAW